MLAYSVLGIALHTAIYRTIDFQPIRVEIIALAVGFVGLFAPTVEGVIFPSGAVGNILPYGPFVVIALIRLFGREY